MTLFIVSVWLDVEGGRLLRKPPYLFYLTIYLYSSPNWLAIIQAYNKPSSAIVRKLLFSVFRAQACTGRLVRRPGS